MFKEEEKEVNAYSCCYEIVQNPEFVNSELDLPKPMNDLMLVLLQRLERYFISDAINYFRTERGLNLIKLMFWYCFLFIIGDSEMKEKQKNPKNALGLLHDVIFFFFLLF
jgi:hypothetical protein